ncbi:MAG: amino acid adenylation domain-containing protein [Acidobacteriia bacterium]|nr:amino acid adenylation domain-containing protein [Terriglobia bacterium]
MSNIAVPALEGVALSLQQNRVWRLQQETHRNLRTRFAITIRGPIDHARLEAAWNQVEERYQILRTSFEYLPGIKDPLQVVQALGSSLRFADAMLNGDDPFKPELFSEMESGKSSTGGNQVLVTLYKINEKRHILAFSLPVLLADGETARIIFQELCRFYESGGAEQAETIQYAQFSEWYSELLAGDDIAEIRSYWQRRGELAATEFPLKCKKDSASNPASIVGIPLSRALQSLLDQVTQNLESTIPDFLFAAWQVLLYRFTGQSPVVLGCLIDGRKYEELDGMPGLTARYLPVACRMDDNLRFRDVLKQSTIEREDVYQYQEGFPGTSSETNIASGPPVAFESYTLPLAHSIGKLTFRLAGVVSEVDLPDLVLACTQNEKSVELVIRFDSDVYDSSYVERISESYRILIEVALQRPEVALADLPLLNEPKFMRWLEQINGPQKSLANISFVHDVIAQVAQDHPNEIAIEGEGVAVSYGKMLTEADGLARQLRDLGIGPESVVAILMEHSPELIVAILGVLRSGAAYLPIDPALPQERIAYMLEDSHARLLLTKEAFVPSLPARRPELLLVKPDWQSQAVKIGVASDNRPNLVPENLAYLIYTSGSTGAPKASMITHRGLSNYVQWAIEAYRVKQGAGAPLHSSIGFDLTVTSVFGPLVAGKKIVLTSMEGLSDCLRANENFSLLKVTPAHARILGTQLPSVEAPGKARYLVLGGEALRPGDIEFWHQHAPGTVLINEYGPTETVVGCCVYQVAGALAQGEVVPIGKPIANTQMYVFDQQLHPVPVGVTGEIYVAGEGLARGYLNRPDLTAERFLPHPCSSVPGARIYRTGDLGRYLIDGNLDCLGRTDHQVKIRGYRVELGEVESMLEKIPAVGQACVIARNTNRGAQLVAYLVAAADEEKKSIPVSELREHLSRHLPEYMVPAVYVWLKELPLTANGKVDRKALPSPDEAGMEIGKYTEPRTLEEQILCGIWSQVLSMERIGIDDNYFALGGDSIRSLQIITRAAERGLKFTVGDLFLYQTVRTLAQNLENLKVALEVKAGPFSLITPEDRRLLPEDAEAAYPLTRLQAGMVFHRELHPESAVYHDIGTFHLRLPLHEEALREAIRRVIARHPTLRTSFDLVSYSQPLQIVHREAPVPFTLVDLTHLDEKAQKTALDEWVEADKHRAFDITQYPLIRFHVHKRSAETFQFSLSFHHAILDGWSDASMLTEIAETYLHELGGETFNPPLPQTQFRDFVLLEMQAIESEEHRRFWQERLEGSEFIRVPRWKPTPIARDRGIGYCEVEISDDLSNALKRLALSAAVPIKNVLLAAHMRALAMLSGKTDVTTLLTSVGRPETPDGDSVLGLFLNSTPFRMKLSGGKWRQLVDEAFALETPAVPSRRYPMVEIQKLLGRNQISETGFYFTHFHIYHGLDRFEQFQLLEHYYYEETNINLLANFSVEAFTDKVRFHLTCDQTEIGPEQLAALAGYYHRILSEMATHPDDSYDSLSFLSQAEYESAMTAAGHCEAQPQTQLWIHEQFSRQALLTPDAFAVWDGTGPLTYKQLDEQSNQLAHYLRSVSVQSEVIVGLLLERSQDVAISVLGVLKAGGAYLPLDPGYPWERLDFILRDAGVKVLITQQKFKERFAALPVSIFYIDVDRGSLSHSIHEPPKAVASSETLAYVIYTSGSTGQPKGVMISHGNLANYISWCKANYLPAEGKGSLVHSSISFDLTVTSLLAPLVAGQTAAMVADAIGIEALGDAFRQGRDLSFVKLTPSHLRLLREQLAEADLAGHTKALIIGGEALHWEDIQHWHAAVPECRMINEYGPTEATVGCCVFCVEGETAANAGDVPIGHPITNATLYVLDEFLQPAPIMTPGELFIGGVCVARGYLNRPGLTAEKFIPDPFSSIEGARLYRTGDLARRLTDGNLDFLGRRDNQLKIRGFRIELGEIEAVLNGHEAVAQAVVLARTFKNSERQLVAYVVPARSSISIDELRSYLQSKLPDYMVPAVIVSLEKLPLTRNGKVDHAALPDPVASRAAGLPEFVAPRTPEEQILAGVWAKALKVERVGIDDDYFALGGDSIRSIQIVALSRERGLLFTLQQLFQNPTVHRLAEALHSQQVNSAVSPVTEHFSLISEQDRALLPAEVEDAYPLSRMQAGMIYHRELHPEAAIYHDIMSAHVKAPFRQDFLEQAIRQLCSRHPVLRTSFDLSRYSVPLQLVHSFVPLPLAVEDLRGLDRAAQEAAIAEWMESEKARGFDISQAPLLRFQIHRRSDETFQFTFCFHHAILDGWSDATIQTELGQSYMFLLYGEAPPFIAPQTKYREFIALEQEALRSSEARDFWLKKLEGAEPILLPRPNQPASGPAEKRGVFRVNVPISPVLSEQLQKLALSAAVPVKTVLFAAHFAVMQWVSGRSDVLTSTVANGRPETTDGDRILGLFLNSTPFRMQVGRTCWTDLIRNIFAAEREVLPFRRFPLIELQQLLKRPRLSEVMFYFTHYHIYRQLDRFADLEVLEERPYEESSYTLVSMFSVDPHTNRVAAQLCFDRTQVSQAFGELMTSWYEQALTSLTADPESLVASSPALSPEQRHTVLEVWNDTRRGYPRNETTVSVFEQQARVTPFAIALVSDEKTLTYDELNRQANRVAHWLTRQGAKPETLVGLCMERSLETYVVMLGIVKAGAAYVPLDPAYPAPRLEFLVKDSGVSFVLTTEKLQKLLPAALTKVIPLDRFWKEISAEKEFDPEVKASAESLVYLMYTSGSTGAPKGAMITHRGVVRLVKNNWFCDLSGSQTFLQFAPISFDASTWEIWGALLNGARLAVCPSGAASLEELDTAIRKHHVSVLWLTAPLFHQLVNHAPHILKPVKTLLAGGDVLVPDGVVKALNFLEGGAVVNGYGPTENTTFTCCHPMRSADQVGVAVSIGRPIANTQVYSLNEEMELLPPGIAGELFIAGDGLARGYINRPDLTAEKFVPHPFSSQPGERLYRTGDLVRYGTDGEIDFIGRVDNQIKIRGYRVELGEIESVLRQHPEVHEVAVAVRGAGDNKRVVAYVTPRQGREIRAAELKQFLQSRLPEFMVPSFVMVLDKIPLKTSGKIDHEALAAIEERNDDRPYTPPQTPLEAELARLWQEVLVVPQVGREDNFFELGGHSLLAIQLVSRIREQYHTPFPIRELMQTPTLFGLAEAVQTAIWASQAQQSAGQDLNKEEFIV